MYLFMSNSTILFLIVNSLFGVFGLKRDENGEWRKKLYNDKVHSLYRSPNIARMI